MTVHRLAITMTAQKEAGMKKHPIIFVDDDALYLRLVESIVVQAGIKAHYATSGEDALEILRGHHLELMVTDLNMRGMDGYALSRQARKLIPGLRIILITGEVSPDISLLAERAGISRVIGKPCEAGQIREIISTAQPEAGTLHSVGAGH